MMSEELVNVFEEEIEFNGNFIEFINLSSDKNQQQTNKTFSEKWEKVEEEDEMEEMVLDQKKWFLSLYGFDDENQIQDYLKDKAIILDAGCGLGYKTAWLAELAPKSIVIGMDFSEAANIAAEKYKHLSNAFFIRGDIGNTGIKAESIDFTLCDQVIMHTVNPEITFSHLTNITKRGGEFACYVYAKKALPRELLDDYFRKETHVISSKELWEMSKQLTELGRRLTELNVTFEAPHIPLLGIKGGEYDIQRFIYWNFLKCFYRSDWKRGLCDSTNFDWYSPSNAKRYSEAEFKQMIKENDLSIKYFHQEEACYSGRFVK